MIYKNLKITTKLVFSSTVFILPIALMLFLIISNADLSIGKGSNERMGIGCLRPIAGLLRMVPMHLRAVLEQNPAGGDAGRLDQEIALLLGELITNLGETGDKPKLGNVSGRRYVSGLDLENSWNQMREIRGDQSVALARYNAFTRDLWDLLAYIGDASNLVGDPELESYYFIQLSLDVLPRIQERLIQISNLVHISHTRGTISREDRQQLQAYITLFSLSDTPRLRSSFNAGLAQIENRPGQDPLPYEELVLRGDTYTASAERFIGILELFLAGEEPKVLETPEGSEALEIPENTGITSTELYYAEVLTAAVQASTATYRVWLGALDQLDVLLQQRISGYRDSLYKSLIFAVLTALIAFIIVIFSSAAITRSTRSLKQLFKSLDNNDLSLELTVHSQDEFGELTAAFNRFLSKLRNAFVSFNRDASRVSTSVYDLSAAAKELTTTANEQSASVSEIVSTMEDNKNMSGQVAGKTAEVADLAVKTRELSRRGTELRDANQDMMQDIRDQNDKIIEEIKNLADMLSRISEVIGIIDGIADQTKLIAFNASLEASSSGEAGARFAVVASEIRRFADNVVDSTTEIKQKIEEVQAASKTLIMEANNGSIQIDEGYDRMVEQKEVFENIVVNSENVAIRSQQISDLSKQQEYASLQIFATLQEISAGVKQFVVATASASKIADNLNVMSQDLRETVGLYRTNTGDSK
ncbi:MAG: methyl-accepting chemotaxis protein [Treponema sp.]|jgi:methyl-accepting chemotaxis protein|nr:methyl-accepting chemotaxis protein [Treponema sp.]